MKVLLDTTSCCGRPDNPGACYGELAITSQHALAIDSLPSLHKDPFDRMFVAQSIVEGIIRLMADPLVAQYPGPTRKA
jgi:PIN domain nuclease of toxin-antitoxin system